MLGSARRLAGVVGGGGGAGPISYISSRDALHLYRAILRAARQFQWPDKNGTPWSEVLRRSARQEFEAARHERDPEVIARLIFVGHDCLNKTRDKFAEALRKPPPSPPPSSGGGSVILT